MNNFFKNQSKQYPTRVERQGRCCQCNRAALKSSCRPCRPPSSQSLGGSGHIKALISEYKSVGNNAPNAIMSLSSCVSREAKKGGVTQKTIAKQNNTVM